MRTQSYLTTLILIPLVILGVACADDDPSGMINPDNLPPEQLQDMADVHLPDLNIGVVPNPVDPDVTTTADVGDGVVPPEDVSGPDEVVSDVAVSDVAAPDGESPDLLQDDITEEQIVCVGPDPKFPTFSKTCTTVADCTVVFHTTDCCGTRAAWGIRNDQRAAFDAAEATCISQMPDCDCAPQATLTDDGNIAMANDDAYVTCDAGQCTTHSASPPPTDGSALQTWLEKGHYTTWPAEAASHASAGPHFGKVRVFQNQRLYAASKAGSASWPFGAASIKELFGEGSVPIGWSVSVKIQENPPAGDGFYWYELYQGQKYADGPSVPLCVNCHASGIDYILTKIP